MAAAKDILVESPNTLNSTKPALPPIEDLIPLLEEIWGSGQLTNSGPISQRFEKALCEFLDVEHIVLVSSATSGLMMTLRLFGGGGEGGEVITTPFTFLATANSIAWAGLKPVFVDIEPGSLNMDPERIQDAITPHTRAILPVHCFGRACRVTEIEQVAQSHSLPVIYDAAHAFGVSWIGESILARGLASVVSFHATKAFHTFEGGAIICQDAHTKNLLEQMKNHGLGTQSNTASMGLNAKMDEFNAALGLLQLDRFEALRGARRKVAEYYREKLRQIQGISTFAVEKQQDENYGYFPISIGPEYPLSIDDLCVTLKEQGICAKRYFFPLVSELAPYCQEKSAAPENLPVAHHAANRVLCLPIYPDLSQEDKERVMEAIRVPG